MKKTVNKYAFAKEFITMARETFSKPVAIAVTTDMLG